MLQKRGSPVFLGRNFLSFADLEVRSICDFFFLYYDYKRHWLLNWFLIVFEMFWKITSGSRVLGGRSWSIPQELQCGDLDAAQSSGITSVWRPARSPILSNCSVCWPARFPIPRNWSVWWSPNTSRHDWKRGQKSSGHGSFWIISGVLLNHPDMGPAARAN